jgi:hypothetical protein
MNALFDMPSTSTRAWSMHRDASTRSSTDVMNPTSVEPVDVAVDSTTIVSPGVPPPLAQPADGRAITAGPTTIVVDVAGGVVFSGVASVGGMADVTTPARRVVTTSRDDVDVKAVFGPEPVEHAAPNTPANTHMPTATPRRREPFPIRPT